DYPDSPWIALVDHNDLPFGCSGKRIHSIVDHHVDTFESMIQSDADDNLVLTSPEGWRGERLRWIEGPKIGSCATMITRLWKELIDNETIGNDTMSSDVHWLLLSTIIRDTIGLKESFRNIRWGLEDIAMFNWLKERIEDREELQVNLESVMGEFEALKSNRSLHQSMGMDGMLAMDMKIYKYKRIDNSDLGNKELQETTIIYSSMTIPLKELMELFDPLSFHSAVQSLMQQHQAQFGILMSCSPDSNGEMERFMAIADPLGAGMELETTALFFSVRLSFVDTLNRFFATTTHRFARHVEHAVQ
ncbi:uncharacterized protein LOC129617315, partial [Condylostylus longicornis]|uniref:uncharacterized protein LOC129617315 n=1 Tax=Condylostylus longicornis TaxID=2530218 RepID=UPI00244DB402